MIDWLPATDFEDGRPGRIGMTVLPGKQGRSLRYPGRVYRNDLATDLDALRQAGISRLLLLVDDDELARWSDVTIVQRAARFGVEIHRHPIPDGSPPDSIAAMDAIQVALTEARAVADVAVACMGGVGRTGTVAACALICAGWHDDAAISRVRAVRHPTAVETPSQEDFVRRYWVERQADQVRSSRE
ncbi:MAG: hypothetical protein ACR2GO_03905 [Candidatus Limnocylindria bacterium]